MDMSLETLPVDRLIPYARNSRTHDKAQVSQIAASIKEFGFTNPVLIDEADGIIAGHGRLLAARTLGLVEVPCVRLSHLTDAQKRAYVIADNRLALNAGWDMEMLALEVANLDSDGFDLDLLGFEDAELRAMLADDPIVGLTDPDEVPEVPEDPLSRRGDVWLLGPHRVMCGDSLSASDVHLLMDGQLADMVWTDPPYLMKFDGAINHEGKKSRSGARHKAIANDDLSKQDGEQFLRDFTSQVRSWCLGPWYITFYRLGIDQMFEALKANGLRWRNLIIWRKDNHNLSNSDYKSIYEPMFVGWDDDYTPMLYGWQQEHTWHGKKNERDVWEVALPSVWEIARTRKNDLHPTMKPVELIERCLSNSTQAGDVVLDFFGGSGSTLIAAAKSGRVARIIELEPAYCDTMITRWQDFTGHEAVHAVTGEKYSDLKNERTQKAGA